LVFLISTAVLIAGFGYYLFSGIGNDKSRQISLSLALISGQQALENGAAIVSPAQGGRAIIAGSSGTFSAKEFPILQLDLSLSDGVEDLLFFWRRQDDNGNVQTVFLPLNSAKLTFNLEGEKGWYGSISEAGLFVYGNNSTRIAVQSLRLLSATPWLSIKAEINHWYAVWRWDQRTVNFLRWEGIYFNPVPTVAVGLMFFLLVFIVSRLNTRRSVLMLTAFGWLILDGRWYWEQYHQWVDLDNQIVEFSNERVLSLDADMYRELDRLKNSVLPRESVRVQIVKAGPPNDYWRWKAQYYLLPYPVYNYGSKPAWGKLQKDDWVFVMGEIPGLQYDESLGLYSGNRRLAAQLMDKGKLGKLYRIR
jgi:hypothetical protein